MIVITLGCSSGAPEDDSQSPELQADDAALVVVKKARLKVRVDKESSAFDGDAQWAAFRRRFPEAHAWAVRDRLDTLRTPDGWVARSWGALEAQWLARPASANAAPVSLDSIWPAAKVVSVPACPSDTVDCNPEQPLRFEIVEPSRDVRERLLNLLWEHALAVLDETPALRVSAKLARATSRATKIRRMRSGFELSVERTAGGLPVTGGPQRLRFDVTGRFQGFNKGFISAAEHAAVESALAAALSPTASLNQAKSHVAQVWRDNNLTAQSEPTKLRHQSRAYEAKLGRVVDEFALTDAKGTGGHRVEIDAITGEVLSDYPEDAFFGDAKVKRASYSSGDLFNASKVVATGVYTAASSSLEHDFFYIKSDVRCMSGALETCPSCGANPSPAERCSLNPVDHCAEAYDSSADGYIRSNRRADRDFSVYSGTLATEGHVYFWARNYLQWQKQALANLGLLPSSVSNYEKTLLVVNPCRSTTYYATSTFVRTDTTATDGLSRIFFRNYETLVHSSTDFGEFDYVPSGAVIGHELNHFVMEKYLGIESSLSCASGNENRIFHEGVLGTFMPQLYWEHVFGVGYAPSPSSKLWFSNSSIGRVHNGTSGLMTRTTHPCSSSGTAVYSSGRVLGQALWKTVFGVDFNSAGTPLSIAAMSSSIPAVEAVYQAVIDAEGGSLEELAFWYTWYVRFDLGLISSSQEVGWCRMFGRHELNGEFHSDCHL